MIDEVVGITIIGAGIVGLAIAKELSTQNKNVVLLEKNDSYGMETSSRAGEVVHSGLYFPAGFFKGDFCRVGNLALYETCAKHNILHKRVGKLIVANGAQQIDQLEKIMADGKKNGVDDLLFLSQRQIRSLETEVWAEAGLFSPSTGILDSHMLMYYFLKTAESNGVKAVYRSHVTSIQFNGKDYVVEVNSGEYFFKTRLLVNSAGLYADRIARLAGIDTDKEGYQIHYSKGAFYSASPSPMLKHLVWPVNVWNKEGNKKSGIHADLDLASIVKFGPAWTYVNEIDYSLDESQKEAFYDSISTYLPEVTKESLKPSMSGIRPQLQGPDEPYRDFVIKDEADLGYPGLINLIGIECPGLTTCIPIAQYVSSLTKPYLYR
jgi:L-2-hydroxyglutarate oxidase LhgO